MITICIIKHKGWNITNWDIHAAWLLYLLEEAKTFLIFTVKQGRRLFIDKRDAENLDFFFSKHRNTKRNKINGLKCVSTFFSPILLRFAISSFTSDRKWSVAEHLFLLQFIRYWVCCFSQKHKNFNQQYTVSEFTSLCSDALWRLV